MTERKTCGGSFYVSDEDSGMRIKGYSFCTHCGGLEPDEAIQLVKDGWEIEKTDKAYKFYLSGPYPPKDWLTFPNGHMVPLFDHRVKLYRQDMTDRQSQLFLIAVGERGPMGQRN